MKEIFIVLIICLFSSEFLLSQYYCNETSICSGNEKIKIMVLFTDAATNELNEGAGDCDGDGVPNTTINCLIGQIEGINDSSNINVDYEVSHIAHVAFQESGTTKNDLDKLNNPSDGNIDHIHNWRDYYDADVVCLLTDGNYANSSGRADFTYITFQRNGEDVSVRVVDEERAFCVVEASAAFSQFTLPHELAHIMGVGHDTSSLGNLPPEEALLCSSSVGYIHPNQEWCTIMGSCIPSGGERIPFFFKS